MTTRRMLRYAVTAATVALIVAACGGGPGTGRNGMQTPAYVGTWHVKKLTATAPAATIVFEKDTFTVTAGDGTGPIGTNPLFRTVLKAEVSGTMMVDGTSFTLTVDMVEPTFAPTVPVAKQQELKVTILGALRSADDAPVTVTIDEDGTMMTITGKFVETVLNLPADTTLTACKNMPCAS